jgi:hypothetical protein
MGTRSICPHLPDHCSGHLLPTGTPQRKSVGGDRSTWLVQPPPGSLGHLYDAPLIQSLDLLSPSQKALVKACCQGDPISSSPPQGHPSVLQSSAQVVLLEREEEEEGNRPGGDRTWHDVTLAAFESPNREQKQTTWTPDLHCLQRFVFLAALSSVHSLEKAHHQTDRSTFQPPGSPPDPRT